MCIPYGRTFSLVLRSRSSFKVKIIKVTVLKKMAMVGWGWHLKKKKWFTNIACLCLAHLSMKFLSNEDLMLINVCCNACYKGYLKSLLRAVWSVKCFQDETHGQVHFTVLH